MIHIPFVCTVMLSDLEFKFKKIITILRMWLLVLALALLGSCCAAEDISGCCTHLAVTRWVVVSWMDDDDLVVFLQ